MIIYNARVITWEEENRVLENHAVVIQGKLIKDLGPSDEMLKKYPDEEKIDAGGKILFTVIDGNDDRDERRHDNASS